MHMLPNAAYGFNVVHSPTDPPPWRITKPKGRTERSKRPKGRPTHNRRPRR